MKLERHAANVARLFVRNIINGFTINVNVCEIICIRARNNLSKMIIMFKKDNDNSIDTTGKSTQSD